MHSLVEMHCALGQNVKGKIILLIKRLAATQTYIYDILSKSVYIKTHSLSFETNFVQRQDCDYRAKALIRDCSFAIDSGRLVPHGAHVSREEISGTAFRSAGEANRRPQSASS